MSITPDHYEALNMKLSAILRIGLQIAQFGQNYKKKGFAYNIR